LTFEISKNPIGIVQPIRALVVDDDQSILKLIYNVMAKRGYEVEGYANAESGLKAHQENPFNLMVLDWFLPGMDGLELCRLIRSLPDGNDVYILVITGGGIGEVLSSVLDAGASDYLQKPFEFERLSVHLTIAERNIVQAKKRRQAERALVENEERLRDFMDNAKDFIQVVDADGKFLYANHYWTEVLGYESGDFEDLTVFDVVHQDSLELLKEKLEEIKEGKDVFLEGMAIKSKSGERLEVEGHATIKRKNDQILIQSIYRDVTDRLKTDGELRLHREQTEKLVRERTRELKYANQQLKKYIDKRRAAEKINRKLAAALNNADEIIIITDLDGIIEYVNPSFNRITGYTSEETLGKRLDFLSSDLSDDSNYKSIWGELQNGEVWSGLLVNKKKDGSVYEEDGTISPLRDDDGNITDFVLVRRDVTQARTLEKQLSQAQKLESIGQLASGIAHEINTPIQYIGDNTRFLQQGFNDLMEFVTECNQLLAEAKKQEVAEEICQKFEELIKNTDSEFLEEEIPQAISQSLEGIDRVAEIVRAMKEFSHPGSDEKNSVDINQLIRNTISVARNEWKYVADVETSFGTNILPLICSAGELNQVFLNIIVNAAHAIKSKMDDDKSARGKITISTNGNDEWVEINISDTGPGIPEEIRDKIFNPFFTTKDVGVGTGQGLAISHSVIVEKHKGSIDCTSEIGKGTTFTIRIPLAEADEPFGE